MNFLKKIKNAFSWGKRRPPFRPAGSPKQEYDSLKSDPLKKKAEIRYQDTLTEQMFNAEKRVQSYADANDLYDSNDAGSILDANIRLAIGTEGGIPIFTGDHAKEAQDVFDEWKKTAGFCEREHYNVMLKLILRTVKLHGDCLIMMDPVLTGNKLRVWDADQIVNLNATDFKRFCDEYGCYDGTPSKGTQWKQVEGSVMNTSGQVMGYFVTSLRNRYAVSMDDASFLPIGLASRVSDKKKITQYRGESLLTPNADLTDDTNTIIKTEVKSGVVNAEHSFIVKRPPSTLNPGIDMLTDEQLIADTGVSEDVIKKIKESVAPTTDFKDLKGKAAIGYIGNDEDVIKMDNANRPSMPIQQWLDKMNDINGKRLGMMSCLSRGRADNSYSSGQIEVSISWAAFEDDQKLLERQVVDYVCKILCPGVAYTVTWPQAFEVDPQKSEATKDARLRGGRTTFRELLGPHWKEQLIELAEEKRFIIDHGLDNLSFLQSVSGALVKTDDNTSENNEEQK